MLENLLEGECTGVAAVVLRTSHAAEETKELAASLALCCEAGDVIMLSGDLGAGKTQFSQGFACGLGVAEPVTSPTFNLVFEYRSGRLPLYHFDLYRLDDIDELDDIGFYELVEGDGVSLVEWGEKFSEAFDDSCLQITIGIEDDGARTIAAIAHGGRASDLLRAWEQRVR